MRPRLPRVRLYESIRTAHLERAHALSPATIIYRVKRYDFDEELVGGLDLVRAGPLRTAWLLMRRGAEILEVNEPLMTSSLASTAVALAGLRIGELLRAVGGQARGGPSRVVAYAIENDDPFARAPSARLRGRLRRAAERRLARIVWRRLDRVAFGTSGAESVYTSRLGAPPERTTTALIPALPAPFAATRADSRRPETALFVGALSERKGIRILIAAWPLVTARLPGARLDVIGTGALEAEVRAAVDLDATATLTLDPPRTAIHEAYDRASVVVLPSQPSPRWREQVGLPIVEALSHGCHVVTTDQTGLADWLASNGHTVVAGSGSPKELAEELADALVDALESPLSPTAVLASLPARDGRLAADDWLFE